MNEQERQNLFSELITRHQSELYGYIYAVVRNWQDTDDLFQSVCLVLWSKFDSFRPGTSFFAWARQTAKNKVSNFLKLKRLPNYVAPEVLDLLSGIPTNSESDAAEPYLIALKHCKDKLPIADEELLDLRYAENLGSLEIAERMQRTQQSVCQSLKRVRRSLLKCIQAEIAQKRHSENEDCTALRLGETETGTSHVKDGSSCEPDGTAPERASDE